MTTSVATTPRAPGHAARRPCTRAERVDRVDVVVRVRRREREREHLVAGALGDRAAAAGREALAVPAQPVHGQEVDARRDPLLRERALVLVARSARERRIDPDDVEVERVRVARVARERRDPVEAGDRLVVERELPRADRRVPLELVELDERDRGEHVGEVRLVAGHGEVVERAVAAAHQPEVADASATSSSVRRHAARPRRRRRSSSRRARSRSASRGRRACARGTGSRRRAPRPPPPAARAPRAGRGRTAGRPGARAGSPSSAR